MKYPLHTELKALHFQKPPSNRKLYPFLNIVLRIFRCKSDDRVNVIVHNIPGYEGAALKSYVIELKASEERLPCLVFFHGGGFLLKASGAHYKIAKEYAWN